MFPARKNNARNFHDDIQKTFDHSKSCMSRRRLFILGTFVFHQTFSSVMNCVALNYVDVASNKCVQIIKVCICLVRLVHLLKSRIYDLKLQIALLRSCPFSRPEWQVFLMIRIRRSKFLSGLYCLHSSI